MKPEDLLHAMGSIPEAYISEAKPKRRGESHTMRQYAAAGSVRRIANGHSDQPAQTRRRSSTGKDSIMSNTAQPVWQRVTTGIVAAAACTVFIGGGVFIAQQAALNAPDAATEQRITNFLGGSGEIHVADDNMVLMYDDSKVYLFHGMPSVDRYGAEVSPLYPADANLVETLSHVRWDGEQFYELDGTSLYRMDMMGNREETPFVDMVNPDDIPAIENNLENSTLDTGYIRKLSDGYYVIWYTMYGDEMHGGIPWISFGYVYQPETGERVSVPNESVLADYLSDGENTYYTPAAKNGGLYQVQLDTTWTKHFSMNSHMLSEANGWMLADNSLYYMVHIPEGNHCSYGKIDLDTHAYTEIMAEPPFRAFQSRDGMIYTVTDGKNLVCSNPEWTETEVLYTFDDTMPETVKQNIRQAKQAAELPEDTDDVIRWVDSVDETYILMTMWGDQYALFDRQNGTVRYFCEHMPSDGQAETEEESRNILGGKGALRPVDWDVYSMTDLYRDDEYYYYILSDYHYSDYSERWYRCPLEGGTWEPLPDGTETDTIRLLSDGERVYTDDLEILGGGSLHLDYSEIFREKGDAAQLIGKCAHIWHIRDRYFAVGSWFRTDSTSGGTGGADGTFAVWFDADGNLLEHEIFDSELRLDGAYFCDAAQQNMYLLREGTVSILQTPGYPEEHYTAPVSDPPILTACVADGTTYFFTMYAFYKSDADGNVTLLDESMTVGPRPYLSADGKIYYTKHSREMDGGWGLYQFVPEAGVPVMIADTGIKIPVLCGFAEDPDSAASYDAVLLVSYSDPFSSGYHRESECRFRLIDPVSFAIRAEMVLE